MYTPTDSCFGRVITHTIDMFLQGELLLQLFDVLMSIYVLICEL